MTQFLESEVLEAIAQYDFTARSSREVSFMKGELITLFSQASSDWWRGCVGGREGLIPDKYILIKIRWVTLYIYWIFMNESENVSKMLITACTCEMWNHMKVLIMSKIRTNLPRLGTSKVSISPPILLRGYSWGVVNLKTIAGWGICALFNFKPPCSYMHSYLQKPGQQKQSKHIFPKIRTF